MYEIFIAAFGGVQKKSGGNGVSVVTDFFYI
jgi:hypothetical protein